jgi:hypothetical protein
MDYPVTIYQRPSKACPVTVDFSAGEQQAIFSYLSMLPNDGGKHFGVIAGIRQSKRQHA